MGAIDIEVRALPELLSMIITLVSVGILYLILRKYLYTPVTSYLERRRDKIQADLDGAKVLKEEAAILKDDYEDRIRLARAEGQEIIEGARRRGVELRETIVAEAKDEAATILNRARKDIIREQQKAFEDLKNQTGEMAVLIASKIMEENITFDSQRDLIDRFINEVGNSKWQN